MNEDIVYPKVLPPQYRERNPWGKEGPLADWDLTAEQCAEYRRQVDFAIRLANGHALA